MTFAKLEPKLAPGTQPFVQLRKAGAVYVDKTAYVYELALNEFPQFLMRPPHFGKSTLLATIEELFRHGVKPYDNHPSLFTGLAIEHLWHDIGHYLVLHLDFNELNSDCTTASAFERHLMNYVTSFCREHKIELAKKLVAEPQRFRELFSAMLELVPNRSVVLLIDNCDVPLLYHGANEQELEICRFLMRGIFSAIKRHSNKFRCVVVTGETSFRKLDLDAAGNSFTDLSFEKGFAACCGYTRDELKQYFVPQLRAAAAFRVDCAHEVVSAEQVEALLDELEEGYEGFAFAPDAPQLKVYSPEAVQRFLGAAMT